MNFKFFFFLCFFVFLSVTYPQKKVVLLTLTPSLSFQGFSEWACLNRIFSLSWACDITCSQAHTEEREKQHAAVARKHRTLLREPQHSTSWVWAGKSGEEGGGRAGEADDWQINSLSPQRPSNQGRFGTAAEMAWNDRLTEQGKFISEWLLRL